MPFEVANNATILSWTNSKGIEVLYPEQEHQIGGVKKLRGGAPVCCPIFGPQPDLPVYAQCNLPQHGLVRLGEQGSLTSARREPRHVQFKFIFPGNVRFPWRHHVSVEASLGADLLAHDVVVCTDPNDGTADAEKSPLTPMPISLGFHPYFATNGENFCIHGQGISVTPADLESGHPIYHPVPRSGGIRIEFDTRILLIRDVSGYDGIVTWTDAAKKYVCVEPVLGVNNPRELAANDRIAVRCVVEFET